VNSGRNSVHESAVGVRSEIDYYVGTGGYGGSDLDVQTYLSIGTSRVSCRTVGTTIDRNICDSWKWQTKP
jgi:hypothetical protein